MASSHHVCRLMHRRPPEAWERTGGAGRRRGLFSRRAAQPVLALVTTPMGGRALFCPRGGGGLLCEPGADIWCRASRSLLLTVSCPRGQQEPFLADHHGRAFECFQQDDGVREAETHEPRFLGVISLRATIQRINHVLCTWCHSVIACLAESLTRSVTGALTIQQGCLGLLHEAGGGAVTSGDQSRLWVGS